MSWDAGGCEFVVVVLFIIVVVVFEVESMAPFTWRGCKPGRSRFGIICRLGWGIDYEIEKTENLAVLLGCRAYRGWDSRAEEFPCDIWSDSFIDGGIVLCRGGSGRLVAFRGSRGGWEGCLWLLALALLARVLFGGRRRNLSREYIAKFVVLLVLLGCSLGLNVRKV